METMEMENGNLQILMHMYIRVKPLINYHLQKTPLCAKTT